MSKKPDVWMPLYIGDYLAATAHLDAQESGGYLHLLMHSWKNGYLPSDSESLRRIARISSDAWSNAWIVLRQFFVFDDSGVPRQKRLEEIRSEWSQKKETARDKAHKAAEARWSKDAPSIAQALHNPCPSPSPSPSPISTKAKTLLRAKKRREVQAKPPCKTDIAKARHKEFKAAIGLYWRSKNPDVEMPWGGPEGQALEIWLRESPTTSIEQFTGYLRNRFKSDANHTERPSLWIRHITGYASEPLNKFKQPQSLTGGSNGTFKGKTESSLDAARAAIEAIENRVSSGGVGNPPSSEAGDRRLPSVCV